MKTINININSEKCIKCVKCVRVCPSRIFVQNESDKGIKTLFEETCIGCGHCVAVCPEDAIEHSIFPEGTVHPIDYDRMPTPEQMLLLCKMRRSNRALTSKPIPEESLEMILEAAHRAPTGSNTQQVKFLVVTDPAKVGEIIDFTMNVFGGLLKKLDNAPMRAVIKRIEPGLLSYIPAFKRMQKDYEGGGDMVLRGAKTVIFMYAAKGSRMAEADCNLAYQNGSLMAECLGVSQIYTGFVLNAAEIKKGKLEKLLGVDGTIYAGMALGMPAFRYPNFIDRKPIEVRRI